MSERYTVEHLVAICGGDRAFIDELFANEIIDRSIEITREDLERVRVAWSLVRELEVNMPGVDIILRLREELLATRRQMLELARNLHADDEPT